MNERTFPNVHFGLISLKSQKPNQTGGKTGQIHLGKCEMDVWLPTKLAKKRFLELTASLPEEHDDMVVRAHTTFDAFHQAVFDSEVYEEGSRGSTRVRKAVGVNVPVALREMVDPAVTAEVRQGARADLVAKNAAEKAAAGK